MMQALGLIEVIGYPAAIEAADAALKASNVQLGGLSKVGSGIMTVQLFGDVGAISAAVDAGGKAAERIGKVRAVHVIPRVDESLIGTVVQKGILKAEAVPKQRNIKEVKLSNEEQPIREQKTLDEKEAINEEKVINKKSTQKIDESSEEVVSLEDLKKKSNQELVNLIQTLGITVSDKKLKTAKKNELIHIITEYHK